MQLMKWFDREFPQDLPAWMFPNILERLRGTPARIVERVKNLTNEQLISRQNKKWSIQENIGHLLTLEPLWSGRLEDLLSGAEKLRAADLSNGATALADYNSQSVEGIVKEFSFARQKYVDQLEKLVDSDLAKSALHPRLNKPMTIIDMTFFVAEHDDHHLACISALLREFPVLKQSK